MCFPTCFALSYCPSLNGHFVTKPFLVKKLIYKKTKILKMSSYENNLDNKEQEARIAEIQRLKAAEKFMEIDEGKYECQGCGYIYEPQKGDKFAGIEPGIAFSELPDSFNCPACRSPKNQFKSIKKVIAGFAENQKYGLGANSLTGGQKNLLIFGSLTLAFLLFLGGYFLE